TATAEAINSTIEPLQSAIKYNDIDIVNKLFDKGATLDKEDKQHLALHEAIENNNKDMINLLLQKGADINAKSGNDTLLITEVSKHWPNVDIVKLLLDKGININAQD